MRPSHELPRPIQPPTAASIEDGASSQSFRQSLTVRKLSDNGLIKYHTRKDGNWEYRLSDFGEIVFEPFRR